MQYLSILIQNPFEFTYPDLSRQVQSFRVLTEIKAMPVREKSLVF